MNLQERFRFVFTTAFRGLSQTSSLRCSENVKNSVQTDLEKLIKAKEFYKHAKKCPLCACILNESLDLHLKKYHSMMINFVLRKNPLKTYGKIFGEENIKNISDTEIRWPNGLVVTTDGGSTNGLWYDFKKNIGGQPIDAIAYSKNTDYITAVQFASTEFDFSAELSKTR